MGTSILLYQVMRVPWRACTDARTEPHVPNARGKTQVDILDRVIVNQVITRPLIRGSRGQRGKCHCIYSTSSSATNIGILLAFFITFDCGTQIKMRSVIAMRACQESGSAWKLYNLLQRAKITWTDSKKKGGKEERELNKNRMLRRQIGKPGHKLWQLAGTVGAIA